MHPYQVLQRPLITEKNTALQAEGKYVFEVAREANKHQVKEAVEKAFKVKVTAVNVIIVPGRRRKMGRRIGRRSLLSHTWKKAVVTLKEGDKIELFESV